MQGWSFIARRACPHQTSINRRGLAHPNLTLFGYPKGPAWGRKDAGIIYYLLTGIQQRVHRSICSMPRYASFISLLFECWFPSDMWIAPDSRIYVDPNQRPNGSLCVATSIDMSRQTTMMSTIPIIPITVDATARRPALQPQPSIFNTASNGNTNRPRPLPTAGLIIPDLPIQYSDGTWSTKEESWRIIVRHWQDGARAAHLLWIRRIIVSTNILIDQ